MRLSAVLLVVCAASAWAQDPANGWLGYATAVNPAGGDAVITFIEAQWKVPDDPKRDGAFFSPWFGIESSDNLNLIQPVNPWSANQWQIYNEYFQWVPTHNENSESHRVSAGDTVYGSVTFNAAKQQYTMFHKDLNNKWNVSTTIDVQQKNGVYKNYTIAYFVFEKEWPCEFYPPNNQVTFTNIRIDYNNVTVTPSWSTAFVDDACNNRAHVVSPSEIQITWDSTMQEAGKWDDAVVERMLTEAAALHQPAL